VVVDARRFFSRSEFQSDPRRAVHGVLVDLPDGADAFARVALRLRLAAGQVPDLGAIPLRSVPATAARHEVFGDWRAIGRLSRWAGRDGAPVRATVLEYPGARADLLLTAHRARVDGLSLSRLAAVAVDAGPVDVTGIAIGTPDPAAGGTQPPLAASVGFGLSSGVGGPWTLTRVAGLWPGDAEVAALLVALAAVVIRYGEDGTVVVGCVETGRAGRRDEFSVATLELTKESRIADALASVVLETEPPMMGRVPAIGLIVAHGGPGIRSVPADRAPFPVTMFVEAAPGGAVHALCLCDPSVVSAGVAVDFTRHLSRTIAQVRQRPGSTTVADLELMTPDDLEAVLRAGRRPPEAGDVATTIPSEFVRVARQRPAAVACCDNTTRLTYADLNERSYLMAVALRARGAGRGTRVAVCLDRGVELVVALLAVLRAGATYVPLDVRAPANRLRFIVAEADVRAVVTEREDFASDLSIPVLRPGDLLTGAAAPLDIDAEPAADDCAYVIYTSGTTGRPKGVMVSHRNVHALIEATRADMVLGPEDVWSQYHASSFDVSVWEIWGCLLTGGRLVCVPYWVSRSPAEFRQLLVRERVTILTQTPSAFAQLVEADRVAADALAVRLVICCGETLHMTTLRGWFDRHPPDQCRVVNMYGITETTVHSTSHTVTPAAVATGSRSVGRPLPGWSVSIRDERGRPLPFGARGEIYVGGVGVAFGYLNRPQQTAERFLVDDHQGRVYRSGDVGRLHPDGTVDHLGRLDSQVKLRGHRIELDEIRAVLLERPEVRSAAVVLAGGPGDDTASARLDSYVVLDGGVSLAEIRRHAATILPHYMVPSTVTVIDELPLTTNGKVDLSRLPPPSTRDREARDRAAEPSARSANARPILDSVTTIWSSVFATLVLPGDDFFELGGNSLLAVRLLAEHRAAGLPDLSIEELYQWPVAADVAACLAQRHRRSDHGNATVPD
jgi:amino acid adenylation domain-containing protein